MKAPRTRDAQRRKVYRWETKNVAPLDLTARIEWDELEALVGEVCTAYNCGHPRLRRLADRRGGRAAHANTYELGFKEAGMYRWIVLHELAHWITHDSEGHGPRFMRVYLDLVERFLGGKMRELRKSASAARLRVAPATKVPKPIQKSALRKIERLRAELRFHTAAVARLQDEIVQLRSQRRRAA